jgi:hypothetical protein
VRAPVHACGPRDSENKKGNPAAGHEGSAGKSIRRVHGGEEARREEEGGEEVQGCEGGREAAEGCRQPQVAIPGANASPPRNFPPQSLYRFSSPFRTGTHPLVRWGPEVCCPAMSCVGPCLPQEPNLNTERNRLALGRAATIHLRDVHAITPPQLAAGISRREALDRLSVVRSDPFAKR